MRHCPNCGFEIEEQARFCPSCGSSLAKTQQPPLQQQQSDPNDPFEDPYYQEQIPQNDPFQPVIQNRYPYQNQYPYDRPLPVKKRENYITFIFVTALVFMIIFVLRSISALTSIPDYLEIRNESQNLFVAGLLGIIVTFIVFITMLIFFTFAVSSKNLNNPLQKRAGSSEILFILSITVLSFLVVYLISNIYLVVTFLSFIEDVRYIDDSFGVFILGTTVLSLISSFIFDAALIVFSIINIVKSRLFKLDLRKKLQNPDNQN